jgi:hypothetical protein
MKTLNELVAEFEAEFPGWRISEIARASMAASRDGEGLAAPSGKGWLRSVFPIHPGSHPWGVEAVKDGWEPQERFGTEWAETPEVGVEKIMAEFRLRRDNPHHAHVMDGDILPDCTQCQRDADELGIAQAELPVNIR